MVHVTISYTGYVMWHVWGGVEVCKLTTYLKSFDGEIKITMCFYTFDRDKYIHKVLDIHHIFSIHPVTRPFLSATVTDWVISQSHLTISFSVSSLFFVAPKSPLSLEQQYGAIKLTKQKSWRTESIWTSGLSVHSHLFSLINCPHIIPVSANDLVLQEALKEYHQRLITDNNKISELFLAEYKIKSTSSKSWTIWLQPAMDEHWHTTMLNNGPCPGEQHSMPLSFLFSYKKKDPFCCQQYGNQQWINRDTQCMLDNVQVSNIAPLLSSLHTRSRCHNADSDMVTNNRQTTTMACDEQ